jgi:hypothetical protein
VFGFYIRYLGLLDASIAITVDHNSSHISPFWRRLHESLTNVGQISPTTFISLLLRPTNPRRPHRRYHVEQLVVLCCPVGCHGNLVLSNLLPYNDSFATITSSGNMISGPLFSNGRLLRLHYSDFQPSRHNLIYIRVIHLLNIATGCMSRKL